MGKQAAQDQTSETRRIGGDVLANVRDYREKATRKLGVAPGERETIETAILLGLDVLRRKAGLA